jgi:hypothetical protein
MSAKRPATLARLAALEHFREERLRQQLATSHAAAEQARRRQASDESAWLAVEAARAATIASAQADTGRYLLYALCADAAAARLERSIETTAQAEAETERAAAAWAVGRARREMTAERASRARQEALREGERKTAADLLDTWLGRERDA